MLRGRRVHDSEGCVLDTRRHGRTGSAVGMKRSELSDLGEKRVLMVASTGGHLTQLVRLAPELGVSSDSPWLTFDTPQSRSLLAGREVHFVPYVRPRDYRGVLRASRLVRPVLRDVDATVSTGAGLALAVVPQARIRGIPAVYIESISRVQGPSLSGRLLARMPGVGVFTQHPVWTYGPWRTGPSVLSAYSVVQQPPRFPRRLFVTLGTIAPYRFDRLINAVLNFLGRYPDTEVVWQVGITNRVGLPGLTCTELSQRDFVSRIRWADAVIAHSGVGVAINILDQGKVPLLMARRVRLGEHVDNHQEQILGLLDKQGLAMEATRALSDPDLISEVVGRSVTVSAPERNVAGA